MKKLLVVGLALATALAVAPAAKADSIGFAFTMTGIGTGPSNATPGTGLVTGSGVLTGNSLGGTLYDITGGTNIVINGQSATVIPNPIAPTVNYSLPNLWDYDDVLDTSLPTYFDEAGGLLLQLPGNEQALIFAENGTVLFDEYNTVTGDYTPTFTYPVGNPAAGSSFGYDVSLTVQATPEPSSLLLLGTGLLLLAGIVFRKAKQNVRKASAIREV